MVLFKAGWITNQFARSNLKSYAYFVILTIPINFISTSVYLYYIENQKV
jgi:hypothetical protein